MNALRHHVFELVLGLLSAFAGVTMILLKGGASPEGYIIAVIGLQISAALFKVKTEIHSKVGEKLEVYNLFEKVHDPILLRHALKAVDHCKGSLRRLAEGEICDRADLVFDSITQMVARADREVLAIHFGRKVEHITNWREINLMRNYYQKNLEAVKRGVKVQRIFVLSEGDLCDPETGQLDSGVVEVLNEQSEAGIEVWYVWDKEVAGHGFTEDLIVVDLKWVEHGLGAGGFCSSTGTSKNAFLSVNKRDIEERSDEFRRLRDRARRWRVAGAPVLRPNRNNGVRAALKSELVEISGGRRA